MSAQETTYLSTHESRVRYVVASHGVSCSRQCPHRRPRRQPARPPAAAQGPTLGPALKEVVDANGMRDALKSDPAVKSVLEDEHVHLGSSVAPDGALGASQHLRTFDQLPDRL